MGEGIYKAKASSGFGQHSGFGSAISTLPSLGGQTCPTPPQGDTPAAPTGYKRRRPSDGYWEPYPTAKTNTSIKTCAALCSASSRCKAFEVYIHYPPSTGDCYTFNDLTTNFVPLSGGSRTYIKTTRSRVKMMADAAGVVEIDADTPPLLASSNKTFENAWALLLKASSELQLAGSFKFDLIDLGREVLAANFSAAFTLYKAAFEKRDKALCDTLSAQMLQTIDDYDELLSSDGNFLLGRWIKWARDWGKDEAEKDQFEYGARNQLTLWGPTGQINDYAKKEWGGLVSTYYKQRYSLLFEEAHTCLYEGGTWDISTYCERVYKHEIGWQTDYKTKFPEKPVGDAVEVAKKMYAKYVGESTTPAGKPHPTMATMECGEGVQLCGVLAVMTGLGSGVQNVTGGAIYTHPVPIVHGLWPETAPYGDSKCIAPGDMSAPKRLYSCYTCTEGDRNCTDHHQLLFERHEFLKHGKCAGVRDADDFFGQVCTLSDEPLKILAASRQNGTTSLDDFKEVMEAKGYSVFGSDVKTSQLFLSACVKAGVWRLAAEKDFARVCGAM